MINSSLAVIHILDENTANQIAAGEVVDRPSSIVKELIENALDAQSSRIEIEIKDGGTTLIRISDNGSGMTKNDAQLAILRHATSKIRTAADLIHISSLGFRGEALPSIAAVTKLTLTTRTLTEDFATKLVVEGGSIIQNDPAGASTGTTIKITDLFFNTPARRKFLKSVSAESSHIINITGKLALSRPDVCFTLISNDKLTLCTPGNGSLRDTIISLYGITKHEDLLEISCTRDNIEIKGFIGKPTYLKSNRNWQTLFVNNRLIQSKFINKAIDNAYHSLLPGSGYPLAIIFINVPNESVDVNVHPQKTEIKFSDDKIIYSTVYRAITTTLTETHTAENIATQPILPNNINFNKPSMPFNFSQENTYNKYPTNFPTEHYREIQPTYIASDEQSPPTIIPTESINSAGTGENILSPICQYDRLYIIAVGPDGLYIIDQHAAHERILYDRLALDTERIPVQQLLIPSFIELDDKEIELIENYTDIFYKLGITLESAGPKVARVLEKPFDISEQDLESFIREILILIQASHDPTSHELRHAAMQMSACRSAIKAGDILNLKQMQFLLSELLSTSLPYTCPHGRPIIIRFSSSDLANMFKRT